jgi:hypothetical protein
VVAVEQVAFLLAAQEAEEALEEFRLAGFQQHLQLP